ncbi:hypothetical protein A0J61_00913 [Choanephora cucurbitarum]|uniref:Uncharacterized protein n=1 Tax=Choanephora cucurbitarum TaxID=101091 RepID=A0A1C7NPU4_9FUNG|nr:hypothetical protein A0J61_00913 [Choanephora cucurbitarum]
MAREATSIRMNCYCQTKTTLKSNTLKSSDYYNTAELHNIVLYSSNEAISKLWLPKKKTKASS